MKAAQKDVRTLVMLATKMSTFGIVQLQGEGDDVKPVAFTITEKQRATLLADVQALAKKKSNTYVDVCAEILLKTLTMPLKKGSPGP